MKTSPDNYPPVNSAGRYQPTAKGPRDHDRAIKFALYAEDRDAFGEVAKAQGLRLSELATEIIENYLKNIPKTP